MLQEVRSDIPAEAAELIKDLADKLAGSESLLWLGGLKRFLRKENPWLAQGDEKCPLTTSLAVKHVIDCDAPPFVPAGWVVATLGHQVPGRVTGKFTWNPKQVALYLDPGQENGEVFGHNLIKWFAGKPVLTAHVLDYLLAHPELIPEKWKELYVFFWGTVYCTSDGRTRVRSLYWAAGRWSWFSRWLGDGWRTIYPAAISAC